MNQEERWLSQFIKVKSFIEESVRNQSKLDAEERGMYCNRLRHNKKLFNAGELKV